MSTILKTIISRFSEFSRMPQPQLQRVLVNEIVQNVARLMQAQLRSPERAPIECRLELAEALQKADVVSTPAQSHTDRATERPSLLPEWPVRASTDMQVRKNTVTDGSMGSCRGAGVLQKALTWGR